MTETEFDNLANLLNTVLNIASAVCGASVVLIILACMAISRGSMDRVSIRFTLAISLVDAIKAVALLFYNEFREEGAVCTGVSFAVHYLILLYFFLNAAVALNLQLVFLHGINFDHEVLLWVGSAVAPFLLLGIPLVAGKVGLDVEGGYCEFRDSTSFETSMYVYSCFIFWGFLACLYCTAVVVLVTLRLREQSSFLDRVVNTSFNAALKTKIRKLIRRISFFCLIPIVTQMGYLVLRVIANYTNETYIPLFLISIIGSDIPGILNLAAFLLDPAFSSSLESILRNKGYRVPAFLDSSISETKAECPPKESTTTPLPYAPEDQIGYFVSIKNPKKPGQTVSDKPSLDSDFAILLRISIIEQARPQSCLTQHRYTFEADQFVKRI